MKNKVAFITLPLLAAGINLTLAQPSQAELLTLGQASGGQTIKLDTQSVPYLGKGAGWWSGFTYYLGNRKIPAEVHCGLGEWYSDGTSHKPQSKATQSMIDIVCSAKDIDDSLEDSGAVLVFAPPSNIRSSPNGQVKCSVNSTAVISVYIEPTNGWYLTNNFCQGWIHESQIRPFK